MLVLQAQCGPLLARARRESLMTRLILVAQICLLPLTLLLGSPRAPHAQETWTTIPTITTSDTTGEKPQSKEPFHGHSWWAVLPTNAVAPRAPGSSG